MFCFFFKQKTAYEMRISDWSSDVCSSDLSRSPSPIPAFASDRVIHLVLKRMRRRAERGDFLPLQPDVGVDKVVGHHAAGLEEPAVGVEGLERLVERLAPGGAVPFLYGCPGVQVLLAWAPRGVLVLVAV